METVEEQAEVLEQFAAGDVQAFETVFRQYQNEVYGWIVRIVRDPAAAEDLTVETFWRIYRAHARFDPSRSFGAWARRIASNAALDYLKSGARRETSIDENPAKDDDGDSQWKNHPRLRSDPGDPALRREMRERTTAAFEQLPAKLRIVAMLALIEDQPHAEIADALNISPAAVKSRLFRAVQLLRRKLGNLSYA